MATPTLSFKQQQNIGQSHFFPIDSSFFVFPKPSIKIFVNNFEQSPCLPKTPKWPLPLPPPYPPTPLPHPTATPPTQQFDN
jgi:hypothetical protein